MMGMSLSNVQEKLVREVMKRAEEEGEVFIASLTREELEKTGFDASTMGEFLFVNVYLLDDDGRYKIKYVFDANP